MIANTSFHPAYTSGNEKLKNAVAPIPAWSERFLLAAPGAGSTASIIYHENVVPRMNGSLSTPATPAGGWPIDTYIGDRHRKFHNGDSVELFHVANAITDGDSFVHFRRADVIVTGDVFTTTQYPFIDVANGGTVQGEINALNAILARTVYEHSGEGGTIVVPGRGYVCDEHEVVEYRDMVAIVRDRVKAMIAEGASLAQVRAARVTAGSTRAMVNTGPDNRDVRRSRIQHPEEAGDMNRTSFRFRRHPSLLAAAPLPAHHSFAATYMEDAPPTEIRGTLK
jgi:hypothetical protein